MAYKSKYTAAQIEEKLDTVTNLAVASCPVIITEAKAKDYIKNTKGLSCFIYASIDLGSFPVTNAAALVFDFNTARKQVWLIEFGRNVLYNGAYTVATDELSFVQVP